jgi:hypothetical protein
MVNGKKTQPLDELPEAIETLANNVSDAELEKILLGMVNEGGISIDHESLRLSGTYAHAARVANSLASITGSIPKLLESALKSSREVQSQRDEAIVESLKALQTEGQEKNLEISIAIDKATNNLIQKSGKGSAKDQAKTIMWATAAALASAIMMSVIFSLLLVPQLLRQSRPGDAAFMDWAATEDGKMYQEIFRSGKSTGDSCKRVGKDRGRKKIICEIYIK